MNATNSNRELPRNVTELPYGAYQVRVVSDGCERSATFLWSDYENKELALKAAVEWRDKIRKLHPSKYISVMGFRKKVLGHKKSFFRVGVSRVHKTYKDRDGNPSVLRFQVNYVSPLGKPRIKTFEVGRLDTFGLAEELHAANTAIAFREHWEYCIENALPFETNKYLGWKSKILYPFDPNTLKSFDELMALDDEIQ